MMHRRATSWRAGCAAAAVGVGLVAVGLIGVGLVGVGLGAVGLAMAGEPPSPGEPPRFFGLQAEGRRVVYVCDRSASMSEPDGLPLAAAKRELLASIEGLGDARQFQLIFYNDRPSVFEPGGQQGRPLFADDSVLRQARRFVEAASAAGGTRHEPALRTALRLSPDVIFLLTDAEATHDLSAEEFAGLSERLGKARLLVVQFGGGSGRTSPRLARLARQSGGEYRVVSVE